MTYISSVRDIEAMEQNIWLFFGLPKQFLVFCFEETMTGISVHTYVC